MALQKSAMSLTGGIMRQVTTCHRLMSTKYQFEHLSVTEPSKYVFNIELNRPKKMNAMNHKLWGELGTAFTNLGRDPLCRAIVLSASGKMFTGGIDLADLTKIAGIINADIDTARKAMIIEPMIHWLQDQFTALEKCPVPVIGTVHNACIGGGVDLITATDIRFCTQDAYFQVKEVDMGLAADVGTLARLPKVIGSQSLVNDLCLTARKMHSDEALSSGLVSRVYDSKDSMMAAAVELASSLAAKSPIAVQGTKVNLVHSRDHKVQENLDHVARWNSAFLQTDDVMTAVMASMNKSGPPPDFENVGRNMEDIEEEE